MPAEVITAALSLVGTLVGTLGGIALSSNLTNYRIEQLEKKVEKHNNLITRTYKLEQEFAVMFMYKATGWGDAYPRYDAQNNKSTKQRPDGARQNPSIFFRTRRRYGRITHTTTTS